MELYRKHRPSKLEDVVGNGSVVSILQSKLKNPSAFPHVVLFTGPSGCGKTTLARIVAERLGCSLFDLVEMNCSNNRGVDMVRDLDQKSRLSPSQGPCRIFIWDECHQLTADAQSAALKLLEDTPERAYFFLCTTHPEKLRQAIITRCFDIRVDPLPDNDLKALILRTVKAEKKTLNREAIVNLVKGAGGSARRALVGLERILDLPEDEQTEAAQSAAVEEGEIKDLAYALFERKPWKVVCERLKAVQKQDAEAVRNSVMGLATACLLNGGWGKSMSQVACVLDNFSSAFYDSRFNGVVLAAYNCIEDQ